MSESSFTLNGGHMFMKDEGLADLFPDQFGKYKPTDKNEKLPSEVSISSKEIVAVLVDQSIDRENKLKMLDLLRQELDNLTSIINTKKFILNSPKTTEEKKNETQTVITKTEQKIDSLVVAINTILDQTPQELKSNEVVVALISAKNRPRS